MVDQVFKTTQDVQPWVINWDAPSEKWIQGSTDRRLKIEHHNCLVVLRLQLLIVGDNKQH